MRDRNRDTDIGTGSYCWVYGAKPAIVASGLSHTVILPLLSIVATPPTLAVALLGFRHRNEYSGGRGRACGAQAAHVGLPCTVQHRQLRRLDTLPQTRPSRRSRSREEYPRHLRQTCLEIQWVATGFSERKYATIASRSSSLILAYQRNAINGTSSPPSGRTPVVIAILIS